MKNLGIGLVIGASLASSVGGTFKSLDKSIGQLQAKAKDVKLGIAAGEKWKDLRGEALKLFSALQAGKLDTAGIARFNQLKAATKEAEAEAKKYGFTLGGLNKQLGTMQRFSAVQNGFLRRAEARDVRKQGRLGMMGELAWTTGKLTGLGALLIPSIQAEESFAGVRKVWDMTEDEAVERKKRLFEMSTRVPVSFTGLSEIMAQASQSGIPKEDREAFVEDVAQMGIAFDMSAEAAGAAMTGWRNNLKLSQGEAVLLGDAINHLSNNMDATAPTIIDFLDRVKGVGRLAGMSGESMAALGAAFRQAKVQPEVAARATNSLIMKLTSISQEGKQFDKKLRPLGTSCKALGKAFKEDADKGMMLFLQTVRKSKNPIGLLRDILGQGFADEIAMLVDGIDGYEQALELVSDKSKYAGSMQEEFAARSKTTAMQLQLLKGHLGRAGDALGSVFLPYVVKGAQFLGTLTGSFAQFAEKHPVVVEALGAVAVGFLGLKAATLATRIGWSHIQDGGSIALDILQRIRPSVIANSLAMARMRGEGSALKGMFTVLKGGIGSFVSGASADLKALGGAVKWLWGLCAAHPFIAIGTAVAALGLVIYEHWDTVRAGLVRLGDKIWTFLFFVKDKITDLSDWLGSVWEGIKERWGNVVEGIKTSVSGLGDAIKYPFEVAFGWIESTIGKIQGAWNSFMSLFGLGVEEINTTPISITTDLGSTAAPSISLGGPQGGDIVGHASGGLINRPVVSWVGEDGPEVVVPVGSKHRQQGLFWLGRAASALGMPLSEKGDGASTSWAERLREFSAAVTSAPQAALAGVGGMTNHITINAASGMDESTLADLVVHKIEDWQRGQEARRRGSYHDDAFLG